jgi:hypothetical protein
MCARVVQSTGDNFPGSYRTARETPYKGTIYFSYPNESLSALTSPCFLQSGVQHVVLADDGGYLLPNPKEGLIVFWWVGRPVAHRWVIGGAHEPLSGQIDSQVLARIAAEERRAAFAQLDASVVICTRDRPDKLQRCLASLPQQTWQAREVIVVDNASTDSRTRDVAHAAGAIYVREDRGGLDFARNTGAREATSPIVAYTNDDVLLHPQWLERLVAAFDAQAVAAVTGLVLPAELATEAQRHFEAHWSFGRGYLRQDFDKARFAQHRYGVFPALDQQQTSADLSSRSGCGSQPIPATSRRCSKPLR